jgi:hypothetical protein
VVGTTSARLTRIALENCTVISKRKSPALWESGSSGPVDILAKPEQDHGPPPCRVYGAGPPPSRGDPVSHVLPNENRPDLRSRPGQFRKVLARTKGLRETADKATLAGAREGSATTDFNSGSVTFGSAFSSGDLQQIGFPPTLVGEQTGHSCWEKSSGGSWVRTQTNIFNSLHYI